MIRYQPYWKLPNTSNVITFPPLKAQVSCQAKARRPALQIRILLIRIFRFFSLSTLAIGSGECLATVATKPPAHRPHTDPDGNPDYQAADVNSIGHLKIDPNLPISFQFHTYSSSVPSSTSAYHRGNHLPDGVGSDLFASRSKLAAGRQPSIGGRTKSASFSVSNSGSARQSRATIRRNRNLTCSDKGLLSEATSRHRELHKTLEKNRRAHLRSCFEQLKLELPKTEYAEKKYSHINIIHYAIRYINQLKKTESDHKEELNKLNRIRSNYESSLSSLKQQLIGGLDEQAGHAPSSASQSNDSSLENLNSSEDSDQSDQSKRLYSIRSQKEIDDLLLQVEKMQSMLCASSEAGSETTPFSSDQCLDISDEPDDALGDEYDDTTTTASG